MRWITSAAFSHSFFGWFCPNNPAIASSAALLFALSAQPSGAQPACPQPQSSTFSHYKKLNVSDGWFEVYQLPGRVYAFYEPRQEQQVLSYLIVGGKRALLFDSGLGIGRLSEVVRRITALPVVVLNSHTHFDHVGGNSEFSDVYAVDSPFTRKNAEGHPNAYMLKNAGPGGACPPLPVGFDFARYSSRAFHITHTVRDGEIIDLGGRPLEVLLTPGHTPDALCLLDRQQHELFTGDTFYPDDIWLWWPETDLDAYQKSIERIAGLAPSLRVLRPAHSAPEADPALLGKVALALPQARSGKMPYKIQPGRRVYEFSGFSIALSDVAEPRPTEPRP
jgi:glyoxylase-like metal-dependent hydrolase (beta-lactamase superfamily II)